ncbi:hypothetical protein [Streptomyces chartreusis]|uniref:hypothetical protein n=1 Tax=Streptomyces chartreusis TaxID=1969 RepID=UPI00123C93AD|nr:hypothetical protein [Streptomyces chartreusis]QEV70258.1 hypothetical protein CP983_28860 [Streptomyces chartreusis]GGX12667.1 hypothetical protein GCM10010321_28960 [Streptomyces chartreusis]
MTETPLEFTGAGTEADPLTFDAMRPSTPDQADASIAGLATTAKGHAAAFSSNADLSSALPADLRDIVRDASMAITSTLSTARDARTKADSIRNDVQIYPQGRELLAGEAIKTATNKVAESFESADAKLEVATALTYEAARPLISPEDSMPARADLQMLTQRHLGKPGELSDTLKRLAQRSDGVGALVADPRFLGDFLDSQGIDTDMREAVLTLVSAEVVRAAAGSGDPKRSAAARTNLALVELRKARVAASAFTRHMLQS